MIQKCFSIIHKLSHHHLMLLRTTTSILMQKITFLLGISLPNWAKLQFSNLHNLYVCSSITSCSSTIPKFGTAIINKVSYVVVILQWVSKKNRVGEIFLNTQYLRLLLLVATINEIYTRHKFKYSLFAT